MTNNHCKLQTLLLSSDEKAKAKFKKKYIKDYLKLLSEKANKKIV